MDRRIKKREKFSFQSYLRRREVGFRPAASNDHFCKKIYVSLAPEISWDNANGNVHGGVFNLEFSPDGSVFIAACEKKTILMFDPLNKKLLHNITSAHQDCVNCVRFLDSRMFASCSDDSTVALWDIRNLSCRIRTLHGHSNWVKNIEYSAKDSLLVTSGFDGSINTWDINSSTEHGLIYKRVFHTTGLMRTRLTPDSTKMIISTTGGYLMIIHDLDLTTLDQDLAGFKPNLYRLMQLSNKAIPMAACFSELFSRSRKKNRVEFITDFPDKDDAEVVSSLQVHPQGWCVLSRNISNDENSEWSCVHDIQENKELDEEEEEEEEERKLAESAEERRNETQTSVDREPSVNSAMRLNSGRDMIGARSLQVTAAEVWDSILVGRGHTHSIRTATDPADIWSEQQDEFDDESVVFDGEQVLEHVPQVTTQSQTFMFDEFDGEHNFGTFSSSSLLRIHKNRPRLTHYLQEPNVGRGFIKELCFSSDGRIICSPYGYGMRLLSFNPECSELPYCFPDCSIKLHHLGCKTAHKDIVVSSKFSPNHCTLITGCLGGKIVWYKPDIM